jgi:hypothetical protein
MRQKNLHLKCVREILPQETKYSIAKQYKITVAELDAANPVLERSFKNWSKNHYTCKKRKQCTHCCCPKRNKKGSHAKGNDRSR